MEKSISRKLRSFGNEDGSRTGIVFWCQGCKDFHSLHLQRPADAPGPTWSWNGDSEKPVITPSVKVTYGAVPDADLGFEEWLKDRMCHSHVGCHGAQPGEIIFLNDCTHALAGTVQPLADLPASMRESAGD